MYGWLKEVNAMEREKEKEKIKKRKKRKINR